MKVFRGLLLRTPDSGGEGLVTLVRVKRHEGFFGDYFCGFLILEVRLLSPLCRVRQHEGF